MSVLMSLNTICSISPRFIPTGGPDKQIIIDGVKWCVPAGYWEDYINGVWIKCKSIKAFDKARGAIE